MVNVRCYQYKEGVLLEIINVRGNRGRTYEKTPMFLAPETARVLGIGLIGDAKAAESYRVEMCDDPAKRQ